MSTHMPVRILAMCMCLAAPKRPSAALKPVQVRESPTCHARVAAIARAWVADAALDFAGSSDLTRSMHALLDELAAADPQATDVVSIRASLNHAVVPASNPPKSTDCALSLVCAEPEDIAAQLTLVCPLPHIHASLQSWAIQRGALHLACHHRPAAPLCDHPCARVCVTIRSLIKRCTPRCTPSSLLPPR